MDLEDVIINVPIMNTLENAENVENAERRRRVFNIPEDPFDLSNKHFIRMFCLSKAAANDLLEIVEPHLIPQTRISAISSVTKIMTALRFFTSGSYQMNIGKNIHMAVSQPTVSRSIHEIINVITRPDIMSQWIHFPSTLAEMKELRTNFYRKYEFPGTIGCIDCTHIAIFPPAANNNVHPEHLYVNRKGYHSINTQLICDWRLKIMNINYPGSSHDSFIWNNSNVKNAVIYLHRLLN